MKLLIVSVVLVFWIITTLIMIGTLVGVFMMVVLGIWDSWLKFGSNLIKNLETY